MHVLKTVTPSKGGRGKKGGASEYALWMGVPRQTMDRWIKAAKVAQTRPQWASLLTYETSLSIIADAPESVWSLLVAAMLKGEWSKESTESAVAMPPPLTPFRMRKKMGAGASRHGA